MKISILYLNLFNNILKVHRKSWKNLTTYLFYEILSMQNNSGILNIWIDGYATYIY